MRGLRRRRPRDWGGTSEGPSVYGDVLQDPCFCRVASVFGFSLFVPSRKARIREVSRSFRLLPERWLNGSLEVFVEVVCRCLLFICFDSLSLK